MMLRTNGDGASRDFSHFKVDVLQLVRYYPVGAFELFVGKGK